MLECRVARITLFYNPDCLVCDRLANARPSWTGSAECVFRLKLLRSERFLPCHRSKRVVRYDPVSRRIASAAGRASETGGPKSDRRSWRSASRPSGPSEVEARGDAEAPRRVG